MTEPNIRVAGPEDCAVIGELLDAFNREFDDPTPGPAKLEKRVRELIAGDDTVVVLGGEEPHGLAILRFRRAIWTEGLECYLAELYVAPDRRGEGLGRALLLAAMQLARERGADYMDLNTGEQDVAARALYESLGFSRTEGKPDGQVSYYYEREL
jgi:ribosomal protein S18 acetylase RimI-like enzyme